MRRTIPLLVALASCSPAAAQSNVRSFGLETVREHRLLPHPDYFVANIAGNGFPGVVLPLNLTISPEGAVTGVELDPDRERSLPNPASYDWNSIRNTAMQWKYIPFASGGHSVAATVDEYVSLVGPRRQPSVHVNPPALGPDSKILITLERTRCYGMCPAYTISIDSQSIRYEGTFATVVEGVHHDHADPAALRQLAQRFIDADFYSLDDQYRLGVTDGTTYILSISIDGHTKTVTDYGGKAVGMPLVVADLEQATDMLAGSNRWVLGREGLVQNLRAEHYDFHTTGAQSILAHAIEHDQAQTVQELLAAGVPLQVLPDAQPPANLGYEFDPTHLDWLSRANDSPAVMPVLLHAKVNDHDQHDKDDALGFAAGRGDLDMVRALIDYGANPKATFKLTKPMRDVLGRPPHTMDNGSVLTRAAGSGNPAVVREILGYHPDLEARDSTGRTAIFTAAEGPFGLKPTQPDRVQCLQLLAAAGANPDVRDNKGDTALWGAATNDVREQLLKMGIDINARNQDGETVLFDLWDPKVVPFFAQHGLDFNVRNKYGEDVSQNLRRRHMKAPEFEAAVAQAAAAQTENAKPPFLSKP